MIDKLGKSILTIFGIGYFKYAPGTVASFLTCIIWFTIDQYTKFSFRGAGKIFILVFLIVILVYSIILIDKLYNKRDAKEIVIDEFIGQSIPLLAFSFRPKDFIPDCCSKFKNDPESIIWFVLAFILFRFFDILKPYPINIVDKKMKNGVGVMLDDIIAGIYSTIVIYIIYALWF
jgi:phosphatidylglycerophosphatase A